MYFYQSKKNYYRFPSKSKIQEYDSKYSYYFPEYNSKITDNLAGTYPDNDDIDYEDHNDFY